MVAASCCSPNVLAQSPGPSPPNLSGTWVPANSEESDRLFNVGLTRIPGSGRLTIIQSSNRFTVTITMPDDRLDGAFANGRFDQTVIYRVYDSGRSGGAGAGKPPEVPPRTAWVDDRLIIPNAVTGAARPVTLIFSVEGERLRIETRVKVDATRSNIIREFFTRVQ